MIEKEEYVSWEFGALCSPSKPELQQVLNHDIYPNVFGPDSMDSYPGFNQDWFFFGDVQTTIDRRKESLETKLAKAICNMCDVKNSCLEDALSDPDSDGIRGGLTSGERRTLLGSQISISIPA